MKITSVAILLLVASYAVVLPGSCYAGAEAEEKIIASVTEVVHPDNAIGDAVTLRMTIHEPSRFGGFQLMVVTKRTERAATRADFPDGGLHVLGLPPATRDALEEQVVSRAAVQETLDRGIDPTRISAIFLLPSVEMEVISMELVVSVVSSEEDAEESGAKKSTTAVRTKESFSPIFSDRFGEVFDVTVEFVEKPRSYYAQNIVKEDWFAKVTAVNGTALKKPVTMEYRSDGEKFTKGSTVTLRAYEDVASLGVNDDWDDTINQVNYRIRHFLRVRSLEAAEESDAE